MPGLPISHIDIKHSLLEIIKQLEKQSGSRGPNLKKITEQLQEIQKGTPHQEAYLLYKDIIREIAKQYHDALASIHSLNHPHVDTDTANAFFDNFTKPGQPGHIYSQLDTIFKQKLDYPKIKEAIIAIEQMKKTLAASPEKTGFFPPEPVVFTKKIKQPAKADPKKQQRPHPEF